MGTKAIGIYFRGTTPLDRLWNLSASLFFIGSRMKFGSCSQNRASNRWRGLSCWEVSTAYCVPSSPS